MQGGSRKYSLRRDCYYESAAKAFIGHGTFCERKKEVYPWILML